MPGYISEFQIYGGSPEFIELAIPAGTDTTSYSVVIYDGAGSIRQTLALGSAETTIDDKDVYLLDPAGDGLVNLGNNDAIALVDDTGTVLQFLSWKGNTVSPSTGPAAGMSSTNVGNSSFGQSYETSDQGASYSPQSSPNPGTIPCFAPGTRISTPSGEREIQTLRAGEHVLTAKGDAKPIRWVQCRIVDFTETPQEHRPILIAAGALGPGRPIHDLIVSAQHRIAAGAFGQLEPVFAEPCLLAAKSLTGIRRVRVMKGKRRIVWYHLALDTHELLLANGCAAESLFFGPTFLHGLTRKQTLRLHNRFPERITPSLEPKDTPALPILRVKSAQQAISGFYQR